MKYEPIAQVVIKKPIFGLIYISCGGAPLVTAIGLENVSGRIYRCNCCGQNLPFVTNGEQLRAEIKPHVCW